MTALRSCAECSDGGRVSGVVLSVVAVTMGVLSGDRSPSGIGKIAGGRFGSAAGVAFDGVSR
jgi:hypothetical protein